PGMERRVVELLYEKELQFDTVITSFDQQALRTVRELTAEVRTGLITEVAPPSLAGDLRALGASFLSIGYKRVTPELMKEMRSKGITVMAWTVNDVSAMKRLAAIDPELMICTNYPDRFAELL
ncbi:glycerophosphodiester phosphodiesterase, partial [Paenibacillus sepulcri]|nr:glycerophosphodiester phosphodiesterase [Paenibacillus sepulcri]